MNFSLCANMSGICLDSHIYAAAKLCSLSVHEFSVACIHVYNYVLLIITAIQMN